MDQNQTNLSEAIPNGSAEFGNVRHDSETVRTVPQSSDEFRTVPTISERKENHTLTVREVARMFEAAGVARTERSIVNWCKPSPTGIARLDSYFDPNERRHYITPQSVELAIAEEQAKAAKNANSEPVTKLPHDDEPSKDDTRTVPNNSERREIRDLENEIRDLQITNRAKDMFIERMQNERDGFFEQLLEASHKVGSLEAKLSLPQIEPPQYHSPDQMPEPESAH